MINKPLLLSKIKKSELISFDIFDTLVIRPFCKPTDLFLQIEKDYNILGFKKERIRAELAIRETCITEDKSDVTLDEIYDEIAYKYKKYKNTEIDYEIKYCLENKKIVDLYKYAKSLSKKIVISSDMYLPKNCIVKILDNIGIENYEKLYLSNHCMNSKADKSMYKMIKNDYSYINPSKILHIGDNKHTDFDNALDENIQAFRVVPVLEQLENNSHIKSLMDIINNSDDLGLSKYFGVMSVLYANTNINSSIEHISSSIVLPLVLNMNIAISKYSKSNDIKKIFFASRDGYIFKHNFDDFFKRENIHTKKLYVSRRTTTVPSSEYDTSEDFAMWAQGMEGATIDELWANLEINNDLLKDDFFEIAQKFDLNNFSDLMDLFQEFFNLHYSYLKKRYAEEKNTFYEYLKSINYYSKDSLVVELGWRGSLQNSIHKLSSNFGEMEMPKWFYLATRDNSHIRIKKDMESLILNKGNSEILQKAISEACDIIELIFAAPEYGVKKINKKNGIYQPIFNNKNKFEEDRISFSKKIYESNTNLTFMLLDYFDIYDYEIEIENLQTLLLKFIEFNIENELDIFSKVKVSANFQNNKYNNLYSLNNIDIKGNL